MSRIKSISIASIITLLVFYACIFHGCKQEFTTGAFYEEESKSMTEYIQARPDSFSIFNEVIKKGNIESTLKAYNPYGNNYTLFLPVNEAVEKFVSKYGNYESIEEMLADEEFVNELARYHVVNMEIETKDFPFGALSDTTLTGDLLIIGYTGGLDSTVIKVNSIASILSPDIEVANGIIHIIDEMLPPIVIDSYQWLDARAENAIFSEALELTGLSETFTIKRNNLPEIYPEVTLLVESDEVFNRAGIYSVNDLIDRYSPDRQDYEDPSNELYQFMAYHILEGKQFINNLEGENSNYNTYGRFPITIDGTGLDIKINEGVTVFDSVFNKNDTTLIDYIRLNYDESNVSSKNGAIHFISNVMEIYRPKPQSQTYQFFEEPIINESSKTPNEYEFEDKEDFEVISWEGVEKIEYVKSPSELAGIWNNDYLLIDGDFTISYQLPRILPGRYTLQIRANDADQGNATIEVFLDSTKVGGNFDLTSNINPGGIHANFNIGEVNLTSYEKHTIMIKALISGKFTWDALIFEPIDE